MTKAFLTAFALLFTLQAEATCYVTSQFDVLINGSYQKGYVSLFWPSDYDDYPRVAILDSTSKPVQTSNLYDCSFQAPHRCGLDFDGGWLTVLRNTSDGVEQASINVGASKQLAVTGIPSQETYVQLVNGNGRAVQLTKTNQVHLCRYPDSFLD